MIDGLQKHINNLFSFGQNLLNNEKNALKFSLIESIAYEIIFQIASPFVSSEETLSFKANIYSSLKQSLLARQMSALSQTIVQHLLPDNEGKKNALRFQKFCGDLASAFLLTDPFKHITTLVHEYGHYFAIKLLEMPQTPVITLNKLGGGTCKYIHYSSDLHATMITAAGPAAQTAFATALITVAHFQETLSFSNLFLNLAGLTVITSNLAYANSAFDNVPPSPHDFAELWHKAGIHPYVSMIPIVALPLLVKSGLVIHDLYSYLKIRHKNKERDFLDQKLNELLQYHNLSPVLKSRAKRVAALMKNEPLIQAVIKENPGFQERLDKFYELINQEVSAS